MSARSALEQARADAGTVLARVQAAVSFQVAQVLQGSLGEIMTPPEQLAALVLLCVSVQLAATLGRGETEFPAIARGVLVVQVGQTLQALLLAAPAQAGGREEVVVGFLLNTLGLCVPSVLELVTPSFVASAYVQNALSVWLFQYASSTREVLARVDFGVSPAIVCLLAFSLSVSARRLSKHATLEALALYKYVARAWHMLLVDWLLRTVTGSSAGLVQGMQIALLAMLVIVVDTLGLGDLSLLRDVRGYIVYRIAGELQGLGVLSADGAIALGAALLAFCAHTGLGALKMRSAVSSSAAEVFFVASVNVLVQSATSGRARPAQQLLNAGLVCVLAYQTHGLLGADGGKARPASK